MIWFPQIIPISSPCLAFSSTAERLARASVMLSVFIASLYRTKCVAYQAERSEPCGSGLCCHTASQDASTPLGSLIFSRHAQPLACKTGTGSLLVANVPQGKANRLDRRAQFSGAKQSARDGQRRSCALL